MTEQAPQPPQQQTTPSARSAAPARYRRLRPGPRLGLALVVVVLGTTAATGYGLGRAEANAAQDPAIALNETVCGTGWSDPAAGPVTFELANGGAHTAEVFVINPHSNAVFADIENLGPHTTRPLRAVLGSGQYAFRCSFTDGTAITSATYTVPGDTAGPAGLPPIVDLDLQDPVGDYRAYVQAALPGLLTAVQQLDADLHAGDLAQARADWLPAHLDYERLGAAYGTFGDFDDEINGRAGGLPLGTADPKFTGFHRIEYGLWHGQSAEQLAPLGDLLVHAVAGLIQQFPEQTTPQTDLPLRAHEILENSLQFQLTGIADYGSGTSLATALANVQGTREVLSVLTPLLQQTDPGVLKPIDAGLAAVQADLQAARQPDGTWTPAAQLPAAQREKLNGDFGGLLEELSLIPNVLEERNSA